MKFLLIALCLCLCLSCIEYETENNAAVSAIGSTQTIARKCAKNELQDLKRFEGWNHDSIEYCREEPYIKCIIHISKPADYIPKAPKAKTPKNWLVTGIFLFSILLIGLFIYLRNKTKKQREHKKGVQNNFKSLFKENYY